MHAKQNIVKRGASDKKSKLSCCKRLFEYIRANLAHFRAEKLQDAKKAFLVKAPGINRLKDNT